mgnify:CR=1 FL=1
MRVDLDRDGHYPIRKEVQPNFFDDPVNTSFASFIALMALGIVFSFGMAIHAGFAQLPQL